jgi:hypothetical protein
MVDRRREGSCVLAAGDAKLSVWGEAARSSMGGVYVGPLFIS